jgi:hypothetical protein
MPRGKFSLLKDMNELLDQHPAWYETMLLNHDIDSPSVVWVQEGDGGSSGHGRG